MRLLIILFLLVGCAKPSSTDLQYVQPPIKPYSYRTWINWQGLHLFTLKTNELYCEGQVGDVRPFCAWSLR